MRLLFCLTHAGLFRNFESTLQLLAERGHEIHVSLDSDRYPSDALQGLLDEHSAVTAGLTPPVAADRWIDFARQARAARDYLRYLDPRYAEAKKLRARAARHAPSWLRPLLAVARDRRPLDRRLRGIERNRPLHAPTAAFLRKQCPDIVAVSSLFGSLVQHEVLRTARALEIPSCLPVASWDNLTNKGVIHAVPDRVLVWNEAQLREAVELHGVPNERVTVTGAQSFDEWFAREPTTSYAEFTERLGLRADRPYVLYLGSSSFIAPEEAAFARRWLAALRRHEDPVLREAGVLFRPHPQNARQWDALEGAEQVAVHPPSRLAPQATGRADWSREDFYDSMHHAALTVGINTTAMIDSAVLGKAVFTVLAPEFRETQGGTLHFEHLRRAGGGLLYVAEELPEHLEQLARALPRAVEPDERARRFVSTFVRPRGLDRPATPFVADALEETAGAPVRSSHPSARGRGLALGATATLAAAAERAERRLRVEARRRRKRRAKRARARRRAVADLHAALRVGWRSPPDARALRPSADGHGAGRALHVRA